MQDTVTMNGTDPATAGSLVVHSAAKHWGTGLLVWEAEDKRGYQFEDGALRVLERRWFDLLRPAPDASEETAAQLREMARSNGAKVVAPRRIAPTLDEQVQRFTAAFARGFVGAPWSLQRRGVGAKRRLKRHRDAAIADAATRLDRGALEMLVEQGAFDEVRDRVVSVLEGTDLITARQLGQLTALPVDASLASALVAWLHEEDGEGRHLDALRIALARAGLRTPSWQLVTAARALVQPERHICVRASVMKQQIACLGASLTLSQHANPSEYARLLLMMNSVRSELGDRGLQTRDLFDVTDFAAVTSRPEAPPPRTLN